MFLKTRVYSLIHHFLFPYVQAIEFIPATFLSVQLISLEAENQITCNYKVIKGQLMSCLSKPGRSRAGEPLWIQLQKEANTKSPRGFTYLTIVLSSYETDSLKWGLLAVVKNHFILHTLWLHEGHAGKENIQEHSLPGQICFPNNWLESKLSLPNHYTHSSLQNTI